MKRVLAFAFLGMMLLGFAASCKSTGGGHCDAYGNKSGKVETPKTDQLPS